MKEPGLTTQAQTFDPRKWQTNDQWGGIQQFRNRAYDPATGTWIQEDPMGVAGGVNLYRFNNGNPVSFGDPLGLCPNCRNELSSRTPEEEARFQENLTPRDRLALGGIAVGAAVGGLGVMALSSGSVTAAAGAASAVPIARALEAGLVKPGGKLAQVLGGIEKGFGTAGPKNALDALGVVKNATSAAGLDPGVATVGKGGAIVLQNVGGVTTTLGSSGSILVKRGSDVLLHLLP